MGRRYKDVIVEVVKPFADKQGIELLSAKDELKKIGEKIDSGSITVEQALPLIDQACDKRGCFLEYLALTNIAETLRRSTR